MSAPAAPLYLDWSFWAAIIAVAALILSQLPPLRVLLRPVSLHVAPYDRLNATHWLGNPQINLHLQLRNTGGRTVRVDSVVLDISSEDQPPFVLPAQSHSRSDGSSGSFLFTGFTLEPDAEWSGYAQLYSQFSSGDERVWKQFIKDLKTDLSSNIKRQSPDARQRQDLVEVSPQLTERMLAFFKAHHKWRAGEYSAVLNVRCTPPSASQTRTFRFTLFETDADELIERSSRYKYGFGVHLPDNALTEVYPRMKDLK